MSPKLRFATVRPAMRSRYLVHEPDRAHFITCTVIAWLPLFTTAACCDLLVASLQHCRAQKGLRIHAWVILDNHFHAILAAPDLSATLRDLKSFTARQLLVQVEKEGREWLLNGLRYYRALHKTSEYQLWQEGSHPQAICDDAMMLQKLEYLHHNPVKRGWVSAPEHWRYSSAHEWMKGGLALFQCDDWR